MSLIKFINNKNVIQKIRTPKVLKNNKLKKLSNLPYTLLESSPVKQHSNSKLRNISNEIVEKNYYDDVINVEDSTLEKCLRYLFGTYHKDRKDGGKSDTRALHQDSQHGKKGSASNVVQKPLPRLLYIQNPIVWLTNKLDFRYLKNWDPAFNESEFTRGARQAVSTITELLSKDMFDALKPLLTKGALLNLRKDVEILWADEVRRNINLSPDDVQLIIPRKLHFRNISGKKFCDIDMVFIALKWLQQTRDIKTNPPLVFIDIIARFHRNYSDGITPDWTISAFKVRRFNVVPQKN
ncbi:hypothetical protein O3M35_000134 [Rhynocoris fuscipes]|uniref:Uncharacterized protein n=1 Tax=Rhynocoris fuscipes TaxID=488301 RepID=A0AAW1DNC0_9HEMI